MRFPFPTLCALILTFVSHVLADDWERDFATPPLETRPRCYWYWMDGVFSKEGITRDLEAMKQVGIGEAYIGIIANQGGPGGEGGLKALSDPWWDHIAHAVREGTRLGVDIGLFNCPGWSQSGGPWVKPEDAMRHLVTRETRVSGPSGLDKVALPDAADFQTVAVLAWPVPQADQDTAASQGARITRAGDGITLSLDAPYTVRSITVRPAKEVRVNAVYQISENGADWKTVRAFEIDRHRLTPGVGPSPLAPVVIAVEPATARHHRLKLDRAADIGEVDLSAAPRIEGIAEKSLEKVFQDPLPPFDFYSWPPQPEPGAPGLAIDPAKVINLTSKLRAGGGIDAELPAGDWIVSVTGMTGTGARNSPAPKESTGLEVDKMNRDALARHFEAYVGELHRRLKPQERASWKHVVADSYEMGPQNWTDGFAVRFQKTYGYDPLPWLPVLSGRVVDTADRSNRFLWDLRRLVADMVATEYVGGLRDLCHGKGLRMWLENYGHWGFPSEFLLYGGHCDEVSGEFWEAGSLGEVELRAASSAAHIYGKPQVFAEAWTGGPAFTSTPWSLKKRGDWALCQGINQFVLHVYIHQPWEDRKPGVNAWFGTEFNRHNTWFGASESWIDYQRRCTTLLQKGVHVADVAYFIGEDAPKMTGLCEPALPAGRDFDFINADVLLRDAKARDGRLVLSNGMSYPVLVLPPGDSMRPEVLRTIGALAKAGVKVIGPRPVRSPGMRDYPKADEEVRSLAAELWDAGLIREEKDLESVLQRANQPPDLSGVDPSEVLFTHRRDGNRHVYFLSNQTDRALDLKPVFRVRGMAPELWDPVAGGITRPAVYDDHGAGTVVPLSLGARGSMFVVFRNPSAPARVVEVTRGGKPVMTAQPLPAMEVKSPDEGFTIAFRVRPEAETTLPKEAARGITGMQDKRNEVMPAAHGDSLVPGGGHAGCGLSVGTNGVVTYEHGAGYFAPVLVHPAAIRGWTHVALVYQKSGPVLYLDGKRVHDGLKGPMITVPSSIGNGFQGEMGNPRIVKRAVSAAEIAAWAAESTDDGRPADMLTVSPSGALNLSVSNAADLTIRRADGSSETLKTTAPPADQELKGSWFLRFPFQGAEEKPFRMDAPVSWTRLDDPRAVHHSGDAVCTHRFTLAEDRVAKDVKATLDLGEVADLAEVRVNGASLGVLWSAPWTVDVTRAVKPGENELEIRVWNTWHNRLLGERGKVPGLAGRAPFVTAPPKIEANAKPLPAGLLGPVRIVFQRVR